MAMSETFLEEQVRRIKQMSARISEAQDRQREVSEWIERDRGLREDQAADTPIERHSGTAKEPAQPQAHARPRRAAKVPARGHRTVVRRRR
jgi:hypothetical protein